MRVIDDIKRIKLVSTIDLIVASLIILLGFVFVFIWSRSAEIFLMFLEFRKLKIYIPLEWVNIFTFLILIIGIFLIIYGFERLINDILKIYFSRKKFISQSLQNHMTGYRRYPPG